MADEWINVQDILQGGGIPASSGVGLNYFMKLIEGEVS